MNLTGTRAFALLAAVSIFTLLRIPNSSKFSVCRRSTITTSLPSFISLAALHDSMPSRRFLHLSCSSIGPSASSYLPRSCRLSRYLSSSSSSCASSSTAYPTHSSGGKDLSRSQRAATTRLAPRENRTSGAARARLLNHDKAISNTVVLTGVGSNLLASDIRRLKPPKKHLPNFKDHNDIVKVIPSRHVKTLVRQPAYNIVFASSAAAQSFIASQQSVYAGPSSHWPDVPLPPGSTPRFSPAGLTAIQEGQILQNLVKSGTSVLLTVDGRTRNKRKLPTTQEVRDLLEDHEVVFDQKDANDITYGLQEINMGDRSVEDSQRTPEPPEDRKWIVRCSDASEAQRVVREFHQRKPRSTGVMFRAEVIY